MMNQNQQKPGLETTRRGWLYGAVAGLALVAGAGAAWWRWRPGAAGTTLPTGFWAGQFDTPAGATLALQSLQGKPLVLNFWATWCPPCIEEMPMLASFYAQNAPNGWQILGIAVDKLAPVQAFLQQKPVPYPVALAGMNGLDLSRNLGNEAGGLPFTVLIGAGGQVLDRKLGKLHADDLARWQKMA